jgi:hypothetical protein
MEIILPLPKDSSTKDQIIADTRAIVEGRAALRQKARSVALAVMGQVQVEEVE